MDLEDVTSSAGLKFDANRDRILGTETIKEESCDTGVASNIKVGALQNLGRKVGSRKR